MPSFFSLFFPMRRIVCAIAMLVAFVSAQTQTGLAVLDLTTKGVPANEGEILGDRLRTELLRTRKYLVLERSQMKEILKEQGFQKSGCTKSDCAVEIGRLIGVDVLLAGTATKVDGSYFLSVRLIDVETGSVLKSADDMQASSLKAAMDGGVKRIVAQLTGEAPPVALPDPLHGAREGDTIVVSTAQQLVAAIRSNAVIALNPGTYNIGKHARVKNRAITWNDNYDGKYPVVTGVSNLTILQRGNGKAEILIDPAYGWVMEFKDCRNITLKDITFGHTSPGQCLGGVLRFEGCENLTLRDLDLFGSGTYGLELKNTSNVSMEGSVVRECTYGLLVLDKVQNVRFVRTEFLDTKEFSLVSIDASEGVKFDRCLFRGNRGSVLFDITDDNEEVAFETCRIENNKASKFCERMGAFDMTSTSFQGNAFKDYTDKVLGSMPIRKDAR